MVQQEREESRAPFEDEPRSRLEAWARTTAGAVWMLLALQAATGVLLAFYYVPSPESAHATVSYIEKVLPAGQWLRALHHYGSQWLTLFLVLHLAQMFWRGDDRRRPVAWAGGVLLLLLVLANGATGYSLPWDARAFYGTRVAEGIAGGLPLIGQAARRWMLGGGRISALTLVRFYAAHLLVVPILMLLVLIARLLMKREILDQKSWLDSDGWRRAQLARQVLVAGLLFLLLALYAWRVYAPLGPMAEDAAPGYLPRPGAQFLWLFQMLKYLPGRAGSLLALALPGLFFAGLLALPLLGKIRRTKLMDQPRSRLGTALFAAALALFTVMTALAYIEDRRDPHVRAQLARQDEEERAFRAQPFEPLKIGPREAGDAAATASPSSSTGTGPINSSGVPDAYLKNCASCHGTRGQGFSIFPKLVGVSAKPHRTVEDLIAILNDPAAYGLKPPMKSFADKLNDAEKRQISEWVASLKKGK
jgi:ubiquinol-cytochrome c reductase cytochrome b subunit